MRAQQPGGQDTTEPDTRDSPRDNEGVNWEHLCLIIEGDHLLDGGALFSLHGADEAVLGRDTRRGARREKNQLAVTVQNPRTSERHARLFRAPGGWFLEDLGSKNGTFLNGSRVVEPTLVLTGDIIQIGRAFFTITRFRGGADADLARDVSSPDADSLSISGFPTLQPALGQYLKKMRPAIESSDPITIVGQSGTGKELLARAIHLCSRAGRPFVPIDCTRLAPGLIESELFGYAKGAYTGADHASPGQIRAADGGTAFLDEILALPIELQPKLLRVIQEREVVPLGTVRPIKVDSRFVVAAQTHLRGVVDSGRFRHDLFARLDQHVIELPPLRVRLGDVGLIIATLLRKYGVNEASPKTLSARGVARILGYSWPLNVRELENKLVSYLRGAKDGALDETAFPEPDVGLGSEQRPEALPTERRELRNRLIALAQKHRGNLTRVADEMKTNRPQVYRWFDAFGLPKDAFRNGGGADEEER